MKLEVVEFHGERVQRTTINHHYDDYASKNEVVSKIQWHRSKTYWFSWKKQDIGKYCHVKISYSFHITSQDTTTNGVGIGHVHVLWWIICSALNLKFHKTSGWVFFKGEEDNTEKKKIVRTIFLISYV